MPESLRSGKKRGLGPESLSDLETYLERTSAIELARRSKFGAPVFGILSLIMLAGTPFLRDFGWLVWVEAGLIMVLSLVRVAYALGFESRYDRVGERAVRSLHALTALQSLTLGVIAGVTIWCYWASYEVVLTITLCAGCVAAGTSALSVRRSAQAIFLVCVLGPLAVGVFLVAGPAKALLISGFLTLMAYLVQDGGVARRTFLQQVRDSYDAELAREWSQVGRTAHESLMNELNYEIRTPINTIIGMTTLLLDEELDKRPRELTTILRSSAASLLQLTERRLAEVVPFRPANEKKVEAAVALKRETMAVLELYERRARDRRVTFESKVADLPDWVTFPRENHVEHVLVNLLNNAFEHCGQGKVSVEARCKPLEGGQLQVEFEVTDSGSGIPDDQLESVFELTGNRGAKPGGTVGGGLGLPMSKGLVELMGGSIGIETRQGEYTRVRFTLPVQMEDGQTWLPAVAQSTDGVLVEFPRELGKRYPLEILVVDDHDLNRGVLCHLLEKMGYRADEASDGSEAVFAVHRKAYDLIFMDLRMPDMSGTEATRWIRERYPDQNVCIVALTGEATEESQGRSRAAGMNGFLAKPVTVEALASVIRHAAKTISRESGERDLDAALTA